MQIVMGKYNKNGFKPFSFTATINDKNIVTNLIIRLIAMCTRPKPEFEALKPWIFNTRYYLALF